MAIKKLSNREKGKLSGEELSDYEDAVSREKRAAPKKTPKKTPKKAAPKKAAPKRAAAAPAPASGGGGGGGGGTPAGTLPGPREASSFARTRGGYDPDTSIDYTNTNPSY